MNHPLRFPSSGKAAKFMTLCFQYINISKYTYSDKWILEHFGVDQLGSIVVGIPEGAVKNVDLSRAIFGKYLGRPNFIHDMFVIVFKTYTSL